MLITGCNINIHGKISGAFWWIPIFICDFSYIGSSRDLRVKEATKPKTDLKCKISVAIDFGTINSAMAYACQPDENDVKVITDWPGGIETNGKIPTAILFDKDQKFVAFGNRAKTKYQNILLNKEQSKFYFFENFKMELYEEKVPYILYA